MAVPCTEK